MKISSSVINMEHEKPGMVNRSKNTLDAKHCLQWLTIMLKMNYFFGLSTFYLRFDSKREEFTMVTNRFQLFVSRVIRTCIILGSFSYLKREEGTPESLATAKLLYSIFGVLGILVYLRTLTKSYEFWKLFTHIYEQHRGPPEEKRRCSIFTTRFLALAILAFWPVFYCVDYFQKLSNHCWSFPDLVNSSRARNNSQLKFPLDSLQLSENSPLTTIDYLTYFLNQLPDFMTSFAFASLLITVVFYGQLTREFRLRHPKNEPYTTENWNPDKFLRELWNVRDTIESLMHLVGTFLGVYLVGSVPFLIYHIADNLFYKDLTGFQICRDLCLLFVYCLWVIYAVFSHSRLNSCVQSSLQRPFPEDGNDPKAKKWFVETVEYSTKGDKLALRGGYTFNVKLLVGLIAYIGFWIIMLKNEKK